MSRVHTLVVLQVLQHSTSSNAQDVVDPLCRPIRSCNIATRCAGRQGGVTHMTEESQATVPLSCSRAEKPSLLSSSRYSQVEKVRLEVEVVDTG